MYVGNITSRLKKEATVKYIEFKHWKIYGRSSQTNSECTIYRDSVVGIATGYVLDDQGIGVRVPVGLRIFSSPRRPDRLWGPLNLLSNGYRRGSFPGGKAARRGAHHSPPSSAEVRNSGAIPPLPHTP
jgi:hypothetical protein